MKRRKPTRPALPVGYRLNRALNCYTLLRMARDDAREAGATRTYARILLALTSCQGAIRNARGRATNATTNPHDREHYRTVRPPKEPRRR